MARFCMPRRVVAASLRSTGKVTLCARAPLRFAPSDRTGDLHGGAAKCSGRTTTFGLLRQTSGDHHVDRPHELSGSRFGRWARRCVVAFGAAVGAVQRFDPRRRRGGAPCEQGRRQLLGLGAWFRRHAAVHDRRLRRSCRRRRYRVGPHGDLPEQVTVLSSGTAALPVTFAEAPGATVTVRGGVNGFRINSRSFVTVRGFTVVDTTGHGINVTQSAHITIEDNNVSGSGTRALGATGRGISLATTTDSLVRRNVTPRQLRRRHLPGPGLDRKRRLRQQELPERPGYVRAAAGIDVRGASSRVTSNAVFDNEDSGINIWDGANGSLVSTTSPIATVITGSTTRDRTTPGSGPTPSTGRSTRASRS